MLRLPTFCKVVGLFFLEWYSHPHRTMCSIVHFSLNRDCHICMGVGNGQNPRKSIALCRFPVRHHSILPKLILLGWRRDHGRGSDYGSARCQLSEQERSDPCRNYNVGHMAKRVSLESQCCTFCMAFCFTRVGRFGCREFLLVLHGVFYAAASMSYWPVRSLVLLQALKLNFHLFKERSSQHRAIVSLSKNGTRGIDWRKGSFENHVEFVCAIFSSK